MSEYIDIVINGKPKYVHAEHINRFFSTKISDVQHPVFISAKFQILQYNFHLCDYGVIKIFMVILGTLKVHHSKEEVG